MVEIKLPEVGENIEKATVVRVLVQKGDTVKKEQPLLEIETDKATVEVPAEVAGVVAEVLVREGEEVEIGATIFKIEAAGTVETTGAAEDSATEIEEELPQVAPQSQQAGAAPRTAAQPAQPAAAPETPPKVEPTLEVEVEQCGGLGDEPEDFIEEELPVAPHREASVSSAAASPSVRRFAREIGVDLAEVEGSGPGGRITMDDVKAASRQEKTMAVAEGGRLLAAAGGALPDFAKWGPVESEKLTAIRRTIAERLSYSWATIPHVHQYDVADITDLEQVRRDHNARLKEGQPRLTITAILLRVCARLLRKYPAFNSSLDAEGERIIYKKYYHLGVAVDTDRGLLVPVVRDADRKSIMEMVSELDDLARRTREKKIKPDEMRGATFTITNLGGIGGTSFNPIINHPEVAILGVARASRQPVMRGGELAERLMLPLCLAYDHRVIDGADGARFLREIKEMLAHPMDLMFEA